MAEQSLSGALTAALDVSGDIAKPVLSGKLSIANGRFENFETGTRLEKLDAALTAGGGSNVTLALSASDGNSGHVKATGSPVRFDHDQNSVFDETGFERQLQRDRVKRLWVGGLALDVCVLASVLDGLKSGFEVNLIREATRPVTAAASWG